MSSSNAFRIVLRVEPTRARVTAALLFSMLPLLRSRLIFISSFAGYS
jgi:hypothetical protein